MLGAIVGDIVGSRFEWDNYKDKDFDLFDEECCYTDDSVMTLAICSAFLKADGDYGNLGNLVVKSMQQFGRRYRWCDYGTSFFRWILSDKPEPYNSWGNGSAMRVSACGWIANSLEEAIILSKKVTEVTHNHPEGIKGAEAVTVAIFMARNGYDKADIKSYIEKNYYELNFTLDEIREDYDFEESCQNSVPQALEAFFEADNFEDTLRNAISIGGDSDTIAAIACSIADAYYGIPEKIAKQTMFYLDEDLIRVLYDFENKFIKRG
jgi:type I restriction enzyme M protein